MVIVTLLSLILVLYTNSFLMKQRNREFGLYNVLGMEKRHIGKILFWETAICTLFVLTGGLTAGIILYKLCALLICRIKEPKAKWLLLLIGIASLSTGYYISITTQEPLKAIELFFAAVILVIIGTYCLFITGSTALLKLLKRNQKFYYQKKHMVAVSGLLYRMKQNAVGLASITILATMVLVMVSTTVSMYAGIGDTIKKQYPHQISMAGFNIVDCFGFVVSDETVFQRIYELQKEAYQEYASEVSCELVIDFEDEEAATAVYDQFADSLKQQMFQYVDSQPNSDGGFGMSVDSKWDTIEYLYGMYGTLLFLGLLLSIVFLFATALIIYYKQISEGYEDRNRFQIMQKVGMSADEVKEAIRSQILLVFFLPLIASAMHIVFAFPILTRLLKVLFQPNQALFMGCTIGSLGIFAVIYVLIYSITAKIYYQIVK